MTLESSSTAVARGLARGAPSQLATGSNGLLQCIDDRQGIECADAVGLYVRKSVQGSKLPFALPKGDPVKTKTSDKGYTRYHGVVASGAPNGIDVALLYDTLQAEALAVVEETSDGNLTGSVRIFVMFRRQTYKTELVSRAYSAGLRCQTRDGAGHGQARGGGSIRYILATPGNLKIWGEFADNEALVNSVLCNMYKAQYEAKAEKLQANLQAQQALIVSNN
eukprot:3063466-Rhodomonas_salina.1